MDQAMTPTDDDVANQASVNRTAGGGGVATHGGAGPGGAQTPLGSPSSDVLPGNLSPPTGHARDVMNPAVTQPDGQITLLRAKLAAAQAIAAAKLAEAEAARLQLELLEAERPQMAAGGSSLPPTDSSFDGFTTAASGLGITVALSAATTPPPDPAAPLPPVAAVTSASGTGRGRRSAGRRGGEARRSGRATRRRAGSPPAARTAHGGGRILTPPC